MLTVNQQTFRVSAALWERAGVISPRSRYYRLAVVVTWVHLLVQLHWMRK